MLLCYHLEIPEEKKIFLGDGKDLVVFEVSETSSCPFCGACGSLCVCVKLKPFFQGRISWSYFLVLPAATNLL